MAEPRRAIARVPATSANLGPGFDAFGLCLGLYDDLAVTTTESGLAVEVSGQGAGVVPTDERHLVVVALRAAVDVLGETQPGLSLATENHIPQGRGLGSSAAAIVAGIRLAQGLFPLADLTDELALGLASDIEGHPDNVAACLFGGLTIAWTDAAGTSAARLDVDARVHATVLVPGQLLSTKLARAVLPASVPHADAAANAGRAGLLVAALTQQPALLHPATMDRLHQDHRGAAMPRSLDVVGALRERGIAATVSGAGPSVLVLSEVAGWSEYADVIPSDWEVLEVAVDAFGATWGSS